MNREEVSAVLQNILQSAPFSMREWAKDAGVGYSAFRSWAYGQRVPTPDTIEKLAETLGARAEQLRELAEELKRAAEESGVD